MKKIIMTICSLVACLSMNAQVTFKIDDFSIKAGESKTITLDLVNPDAEVSSFLCDIFLPDGITIDKNNRGKYNLKFSAATERTTSEYHTLTSALQESGAVRIIGYSTDAELIYGESGTALIDIPVTASADIEGGIFQLKIANQDITNATGQVKYKPEDYIGTVTVEGTSTGINGVNTDNAKSVYNLSGQKMNSVKRGVNIVNKKKIVVK